MLMHLYLSRHHLIMFMVIADYITQIEGAIFNCCHVRGAGET